MRDPSARFAVELLTDPTAFLTAADAGGCGFLGSRQEVNNLLIGVARRLQTTTTQSTATQSTATQSTATQSTATQSTGTTAAAPTPAAADRPVLAVVRRGGVLVGAAVWAPPWRVCLSPMPDPAAEALAQALMNAGRPPNGAVGPTATVRAFTAAVTTAGAGVADSVMRLKLFVARAVTPAPPAPGHARPATEADLPMVTRWYADFHREAAVTHPVDASLAARDAVGRGIVHLWVDQVATSFLTVGRRTGSGASIGPVYTPPEHRRRGYATALVGAVSATLLAEGTGFCCLFTDLENPISNSIYPKVGYRPMEDFEEIVLGPPP